MKRAIKLAIGYSMHSLIPIISWWIWGILKDPDYVSVFTLTYPLQFIWSTILLIFGYGFQTYVLKQEKESTKESLAISGLAIGSALYIIAFVILAFFAVDFKNLMGYVDDKYTIPCVYSILTFILSGIASLLSAYYNFKEDYSKGEKILIKYNLINYTILVMNILIFKNEIVVITLSIAISSLYIFSKLLKEVISNRKNIRLSINIIEPMKLVLVELAEQLGLFVTYIFGIGNLATNNFSIIITFSVWTEVIDWIWDAQSNVAPTMVRIDTATEKFNFRKSVTELLKLDIIFIALIITQLAILYPFIHFDIKWILIFALFDVTDLLIHTLRVTIINYLSTKGDNKIIALQELIGYVIRASITIGIPTLLAMFIAQLVAGAYKTISSLIIYARYNKNLLKTPSR